MKKGYALLYVLVLIIGCEVSCTESIPECPSRMCVVAGGWKLTEVYVDEVKDNSDLSRYQLFLNMPSPSTATTSNFSRTQPGGATDDGTWSLENNETILRLIPDGDPLLTEDWVIESMTPRSMILIMNRDTDIKQGPAKIEFVLEPM